MKRPGQRTRVAALALTCGCLAAAAHDAEDISFVAEHLPEAAMDNRYAALSFTAPQAGLDPFDFIVDAGYSRIATGHLALSGPMLALEAVKSFDRWRLTSLAFFDDLHFGGANDRRPLDEPFVPTPLALPVPAEFSRLEGVARDFGLGVIVSRGAHARGIGDVDVSAGVLWQRLDLSGYRADYRVISGPDSGATGVIDFSGAYTHFVPVAGLSKRFATDNWTFTPHVQAALPLPRRGVTGRITGPGFDLGGNTADNGAGKHFGDPSVTLGFDVTYLPWRLTVDLSSALTQRFAEPYIHPRISENWIITFRFAP